MCLFFDDLPPPPKGFYNPSHSLKGNGENSSLLPRALNGQRWQQKLCQCVQEARKVRKQSVRRFARPTDELMGLAGLPLVR